MKQSFFAFLILSILISQSYADQSKRKPANITLIDDVLNARIALVTNEISSGKVDRDLQRDLDSACRHLLAAMASEKIQRQDKVNAILVLSQNCPGLDTPEVFCK